MPSKSSPKKKQAAKPITKTIKEPSAPWETICDKVADVIANKPLEYIILFEDHKSLLIGKRILMTLMEKNENNIFQPLDINPKGFHYKFFHLYNRLSKKLKLPKIQSPYFFPNNPEQAIYYVLDFK